MSTYGKILIKVLTCSVPVHCMMYHFDHGLYLSSMLYPWGQDTSKRNHKILLTLKTRKKYLFQEISVGKEADMQLSIKCATSYISLVFISTHDFEIAVIISLFGSSYTSALCRASPSDLSTRLRFPMGLSGFVWCA